MIIAIALSGVAVVAVMAVAFTVGRVLGRYRDIDVFWPLGFLAVAVVGFFVSAGNESADSTQRLLLLVMVSLWGLRLAWHLAWRSRGAGEDPRYAQILRGAKGGSEIAYVLRVIYGLQAALLIFISLPVTVGMNTGSPIIVLQILGAFIWAVGFAFETIGDWQLSKFGADPANKFRVMNQGLWAWTRHPNYFGDALVWWGIFIVAASGGWALLTILSPLVMTRLLTSVSGKPLLEKRMASTREGFAEYVEKTSGFIPRPPKR